MMHTPIIPAFFSVPMGAVLLVAVGLHLLSNNRPGVPASRRRIRQANAVVISITVPLLVIGSSFVVPAAQPREWMLVWLANMGLLLVSIGLAMVDAMNNIRLARAARRGLERGLDATVERLLRASAPSGLPRAARDPSP